MTTTAAIIKSADADAAIPGHLAQRAGAEGATLRGGRFHHDGTNKTQRVNVSLVLIDWSVAKATAPDL